MKKIISVFLICTVITFSAAAANKPVTEKKQCNYVGLTLQLSCCTVYFNEEQSNVVMYAIMHYGYWNTWNYFDAIGCSGGGGNGGGGNYA
jgi:hypothetical protein